MELVRVDKFLWCVRLFKTRSMATDACKGGKVKLNGTNVKPSKEVKVGERYSIQRDGNKLDIEVKALLHNRVGAPLVSDYIIDHSPKPDPKEFIPSAFYTTPQRDKGTGRPTKRDRRDIDDLNDNKYD